MLSLTSLFSEDSFNKGVRSASRFHLSLRDRYHQCHAPTRILLLAFRVLPTHSELLESSRGDVDF